MPEQSIHDIYRIAMGQANDPNVPAGTAQPNTNAEWIYYRDTVRAMAQPGASTFNNPVHAIVNGPPAGTVGAVPVSPAEREQRLESVIAGLYRGFTRGQPVDFGPMLNSVGRAGLSSAVSLSNPMAAMGNAFRDALNTLIFDHIPAVRASFGAVKNWLGNAAGHYLTKITNNLMGRNDPVPPMLDWEQAWRMAEAQHDVRLLMNGVRDIPGLSGLNDILVQRRTFNMPPTALQQAAPQATPQVNPLANPQQIAGLFNNSNIGGLPLGGLFTPAPTPTVSRPPGGNTPGGSTP